MCSVHCIWCQALGLRIWTSVSENRIFHAHRALSIEHEPAKSIQSSSEVWNVRLVSNVIVCNVFSLLFFSVSQQRRYVVWKWWNLFGAILSKPNEHTIELTEKESSRSLCMNFIPLERVFIGNYTMHEWNDYEVYYCRLNDLAAWRSPPTIAMLSLT